jgi:CheY-like chemotaxis protein
MHVAVSADASREQIETALSRGFDRYISKPIRLDELLELFDELLRKTDRPEGTGGHCGGRVATDAAP